MASIGELRRIVAGAPDVAKTDLMVCPPATLIASFAAAAQGTHVLIGGQDCHALAAGAYTGDISAEMLKDAGASAVIVGHSERRQYHHETDSQVRAKAEAARRAGLTAIVCVGETRPQREAGRALDVVEAQLQGSLPDGTADFIVAYEPVWAIGTGLTPTPADVAEVHRAIRDHVVVRFGAGGQGTRILYGGSVNPKNCVSLLEIENVDGALVGGASLKAEDFLAIAATYG